jgi:hypothetical protein
MLRAAEQVQISPTQISFTATIRIMDNNLIPLALVNAPRRQHIVESVIKEIGKQRLPLPWVRIQTRSVKRVCSRYKHKKPEHWNVPALELDVEFHQIIAVVECRQGLSSVPEMPLVPSAKETAGLIEGRKTNGSGIGGSSACKPTKDLLDLSSPKTVADASSSVGPLTEAKTSRIREPTNKTG